MILNVIDRGQAVLNVRPSSSLLVLTRQLEGRRKWLNAGGLSLEPTPHNVALLREHIPGLELTGDTRSIAPRTAIERRRDVKKRKPYRPLTKPFRHQRKALKRMRGRPAFGLFMEPGTGKSKVGIDWAGELYADGAIDLVIVVAPKGVHRQWVEKQIPTHLGTPYRAAFWDHARRAFRVPPEQKKPKKKRAIEYLTINYETLIRDTGWNALMAQIEGAAFALIIDESHKAKNHESQRWGKLNELSSHPNCAARLLMTGTPIAKNLVDEWAQLKLIDRSIIGIEYVTAFRNEYCITTGEYGQIVIGARNLEKFKKLTEPYVFRARKADLGIAPKLYDEWVFDMTKRQRRIYTDMARDLVAEIDSGEVATAMNALVKMNRLQQISNGFIITEDEDGNKSPPKSLFNRVEDNPRIEALLELLESYEGAEPTIVWCRYRQDVEHVLEAIPGPLRVAYYGGVKDREKRENLAAFLRPDGPPYFVATTGSAGTGLDALQTRCSRAIYYSNSENSIDRWQSEDRIHRIGTIEPVNIIDLIAVGSRDRAILANLRAKKDLSDLTLDDIKMEILDALANED